LLASPDVLVVGTTIDPHIDAVFEQMPAHVSIARLNVDRFPVEQCVTILPLANQPQVVLDDGQQEWDISRPGASWFRQLGKPGIHESLPERYRPFVLGEAEQQLECVMSLVQPITRLNGYWSCRQAAVKGLQYHIAHMAGLRMPATIMTNSPSAAGNWLADVPNAIAKSIHSPLLTDADIEEARSFVFTNELDAHDRQDLAALQVAPTQLQSLIQRSFEVRITSVAGKHFGIRIDPLTDDLHLLDWRSGEFDCTYDEVVIPEDICDGLDRLFAALDIEYAASDFIVAQDGRWIFLEANPHGAWLWLERAVPSHAVSLAIAEFLSYGARR